MDTKDRAAEALRDEFHDLRKWAETSWNRGFQQGLEANRLLAVQAAEALRKEREAHAETNRAMTDALLMMEEREQRDEALLRQALEALERAHRTAMEQTLKARIPECAEFAGIAQDLDFVVAALRERLGEKEQR